MDLLRGIEERRSINFFDKNKDISDDKINKLIELANISPSSFNLQPWELIIVKSKEAKQRLKPLAFNQAKIEEASINIIVIANPDAVEQNIDDALSSMVEKGYLKEEQKAATRLMPFNLYGEKDSVNRKIFAVKNASFFAMSIMLAAKGLGLETHPMDGFDSDKVKKEFGIADNKIVPVIIAVGQLAEGIKLLPRNYRRKNETFLKIV